MKESKRRLILVIVMCGIVFLIIGCFTLPDPWFMLFWIIMAGLFGYFINPAKCPCGGPTSFYFKENQRCNVWFVQEGRDGLYALIAPIGDDGEEFSPIFFKTEWNEVGGLYPKARGRYRVAYWPFSGNSNKVIINLIRDPDDDEPPPIIPDQDEKIGGSSVSVNDGDKKCCKSSDDPSSPLGQHPSIVQQCVGCGECD